MNENFNCNISCHQFIFLEQITRRPQYDAANLVPVWRDDYGARVGCPLCGEIRVIWANGEVIIEYHGHEFSNEQK